MRPGAASTRAYKLKNGTIGNPDIIVNTTFQFQEGPSDYYKTAKIILDITSNACHATLN